MTDRVRAPLGAFLPWIPSRPDPVPLLLPVHDPQGSHDTALDRSLAEQWESEGGASDTDPPLRPTLRQSAHAPTPLRVATTDELKLERTRLAFEAAQARWEARPREGPVTRNDEAEEPAGKAAGNRARVAYLSTKGATMQGWIAHCAASRP